MIRIKRDDLINLISFDKEEIKEQIANDIIAMAHEKDIMRWHHRLYEYYHKHLREYALLLALGSDDLRNQIINPRDNYTTQYMHEVYDILQELPPLSSDYLVHEGLTESFLNIYNHYGKEGSQITLCRGDQVAYIQEVGVYLMVRVR